MAYSELVKNYEHVRSYMREFYVYGFKSRSEYDHKSLRSYDDEKRRIESWLGNYMRFSQSGEGKNVFLSIDSRKTKHNPFYQSWKACSFTDKDITLHFLIFDILYEPTIEKTLTEIIDEVCERLSVFEEPMSFDESTIRKKLKEYVTAGIVQIRKEGRLVYYRRAQNLDLSDLQDMLDYFSEVMPCGVIGSFLQDRLESHHNIWSFKHHYMTQAVDSDILAILFDAMQKKSRVTITNLARRATEATLLTVVPLKIYISVQNGRQYLAAYHEDLKHLYTYRLDYIQKVKIGTVCEEFPELRKELAALEEHIWGVNCRWNLHRLEHVSFDVVIADDEKHIVNRLEREKRCGVVIKLDDHHYRYEADVVDTTEMIPWIRTFICRITQLDFLNKGAERKFKRDLRTMYELYGIPCDVSFGNKNNACHNLPEAERGGYDLQ